MLERVPMRRSRDLPRLDERPEALSDAISRIFSERASFELRDDDVEALRKQLRNSHLTPGSGPLAFLQAQQEDSELAAWRERHPCLLTHLPQFFRQAKGKRLTVFMDYDGTLAPIVKNPDRAFMSEQMRSAVRAVAELFPTAIISGRGREKVEEFVKLNELFYAGSHGMDIVGPALTTSNGHVLSFQPAAKFEPVMDRIYASLVDRTKSIPGATVEHNKFCVSVHFRNCEPERLSEVVSAVEAVLASNHQLKATRGRKVLEIRPEVEWNKGHALAHLLGALELGDTSDVMPIYIGDDRTDEDAFAVLNRRENGVGILVSSKVKPTEAVFALRDPLEVMTFLTRLVSWGQTQDNAWHEAKACCGWELNTNALLRPSASGKGIHAAENAVSVPPASGRPPLCPSDKARQAAALFADARPVSSDASLDASATVLSASSVHREREANGHTPQQKGEEGNLPASPFWGVPHWADTLTTRSQKAETPFCETDGEVPASSGSKAEEPALEECKSGMPKTKGDSRQTEGE